MDIARIIVQNLVLSVCRVITAKVCKDFRRESANTFAPKVCQDFQNDLQTLAVITPEFCEIVQI